MIKGYDSFVYKHVGIILMSELQAQELQEMAQI